jgi:NADP-dependent 3-hydroxy acid dehydrogenase YdfG
MLGRGRGHIVIISSDAGRKVFPGLAVYSASKYFVEALCKTSVATDLLSLSGDEQALEIYGGQRVLDPENVAAVVVYALYQPEHVAVNEVLVEPRDEPV